MKVLRLRSWNFQAPDLDAMTRFYQVALGADLGAEQTLAGVKVNRLRAGETGLGLFDTTPSTSKDPAIRKN
jgi:predicted enzyme related to lactoylglutathione lyase